MSTEVEPGTAQTRNQGAARALPDDRLKEMLHLLKLARHFDERMEALYRQGRLPGAFYSGRGQEGTHVGVAFALEPKDSLFPTHRDLTAQLTKGLDLNRVMAWDLPDEEATTIAGLVIHEARAIPEQGQKFTFHGFRFEVLRKQRNRITLLRLTPEQKAEERDV